MPTGSSGVWIVSQNSSHPEAKGLSGPIPPSISQGLWTNPRVCVYVGGKVIPISQGPILWRRVQIREGSSQDMEMGGRLAWKGIRAGHQWYWRQLSPCSPRHVECSCPADCSPLPRTQEWVVLWFQQPFLYLPGTSLLNMSWLVYNQSPPLPSPGVGIFHSSGQTEGSGLGTRPKPR